MKITYLHQYFNTPAMVGGTRSYEMARRMVAAGHEVHMITSRTTNEKAGRRWSRETIDGVEVHWLTVPYDNSMGYARRLLSFADFAFRTALHAATIDSDVVFATSTPLTIAIPAVWASRRQKVPMVFEVRDLWPEVPIAMGALSFPFSKMLARMLEQWAYNNATRVVALSPGMAAGVERSGYPRSRIECIPNSADIDLFDVPRSQGEVFRQDRPWLGDRPLVVYSGTFGKVNGVSYLVELASHMLSLDPEVRFLAVGRGIERQAVEDRARALGVLGQIFFMEGAMLKNDMPALLSASSICVSLVIPLEALWHNSANKFFDALAAGRPVAINYGGWQAGLLLDAGAGIVLDPDNPAQGALQLHSFLQNKLALSQACEAAGALARERFSRDALASRLIALLEDVVEDEKRTRVEG